MRWSSLPEPVRISVICVICALVIALYGTFRCMNTKFQDPLTFSIAPPPLDKYLDGWGISHFTFFAVLAYLYPSPTNLLFIWSLGFVWEVIEYSMKDRPFYLSKCNYKITSRDGSGWWYGRWQDIVMNTLGMATGVLIRCMIGSRRRSRFYASYAAVKSGRSR